MSKKEKGFTLAELLIVVAIIAVLVAIAIPVFTNLLEKSRESTDLANARSAYAEVMSAALTEDTTGNSVSYGDGIYSVTINPIKQKAEGWTTDITTISIGDVGSADWIGVPREDGTCTISYDVSAERPIVKWSGNDLSTAEGRRQEDIDTMHSIAGALKKATENGTMYQAKNYVQVAVFKDGTMAFYQDGRGNSDADTKTIRDALEAAGIKTDKATLHSTDAEWKNGCVIHVEKNGTVKYKAISEAENADHEIKWNWWNKKDIEDSDLNN